MHIITLTRDQQTYRLNTILFPCPTLLPLLQVTSPCRLPMM